MDGVVVQATVDEAVDARLEELAASHGIGKGELVADVLRHFVAVDPGYAAFVEAGMKDWREGRVIEHEEVVAAFEKEFGPGH